MGMREPQITLMQAGAYDRCVFTVAEGLNARHGMEATYHATLYAEQAVGEGDAFSADFWKDVLRAIDATSSDISSRIN